MKPCSFVFMYFHTSKFYHKTKRWKEGYKKIEILYVNKGKKIYKMPCCVAVNCINKSEKRIRLFKFPADNIRRQLAVK